MRTLRCLAFASLSLWLLVGTPPSARADNEKAALARLDAKYRSWLDEVALLISKDERKQFLELTQDYQRDGFIHRFWEARNPYPGTSHNPFKSTWEARVESARAAYGNLTEDRARVLLIHGETDVARPDCTTASVAGIAHALWPMEIWHYVEGGRTGGQDSYVIFYRLGAGGPWRLWLPSEGVSTLVEEGGFATGDEIVRFSRLAENSCGSSYDLVMNAVYKSMRSQKLKTDRPDTPPPPRDVEWLRTFRGVSTDLPSGGELMKGAVEVKYPARDGGRTVMQGLVLVPVASATAADLEGHRSYDFLLTGEILQEAELVESFRYRFGMPETSVAGPTLPLAFERTLRPGTYSMVVRVEDLHSHHNYRDELPMTVPSPEGLPAVGSTHESPAVTAALDAARAEVRAAGALSGAAPGGASGAVAGGAGGAAGGAGAAAGAAGGEAAAIRLTPPAEAPQIDALRLEAQASGEGIRKVTFFLDGKEMLTRNRPPYSVELNLGPVPRTREVRVVAYAANGGELASDNLTLNPPKQRFAVHLVEPHGGVTYKGQVLARAEVHIPDGGSFDRLELFLGDARVATLYQEPYAQVIPLAAGAGAKFVRAVAYLADGSSAEDLAVINSPDAVEKIDVRLVELYAGVFDRKNRPVGELKESDFKVLDGGEPQTLLRFEQVRDLPLRLMFALDTSASMAKSLPQVQKAALAFLQRTLKPKDQAALLTFSDSPVMRTPFTGDVGVLASALAGLDAERGTALFDSLVYGLTYMRGAQHSQPALVLFTDGSDHMSHLSFAETLEFARRSGIAIYAIGLQIPLVDRTSRGQLGDLASETGGRSFFVDSASELDGVYAAIEEELRSRYLLAYQAKTPGREGEFHPVEVQVRGDGLHAKTIRGYYP